MKIKNLFFKEEASDELPAAKPKSKEESALRFAKNSTYGTGNTFIEARPAAPNYTPSADFTKLLDEVLNKRDLPGPDFLEFYKALNTLETMPISEQQKYQAAFAGLNVSGLTKDKIVETANTYLEALRGEQSDFQSHMNAVKDKEVIAKRKQSEELGKENAELQQKIADNLVKIGTLNSEAQMKESDLIVKGQQFEASLNAAVQKITDIQTKVQTNIQ